MTNYQRTASWLNACGKQFNNHEQASTAIGVDLEEVSEWLECLRVSQDGWSKVLERIRTDMDDIAEAIKSGKIVAHVPTHMRVKALDALCDREVTANGCAYMLGFAKEEADAEVLDSNDSKLNDDGTGVILPGGKIGKSANYRAPELKEFV